MFTINCPRCGYTLPTQNILQEHSTDNAIGFCFQCNEQFQVPIPSIRKKLVYLDQSFLSAACLETDNPNSQNEVHILAKLTELKALQKIFVVVSDVHSRETSAIPDEYIEDRKKLWQFQNELADGNIANDWEEVFVAQWRRILTDQDNSNLFPATDIGLDNPHQFQFGIRIQRTNHWRPTLHRNYASPRDIVNETFRSSFELQLKNMPISKDVRECLIYVREFWHQDIRQWIDSWRQQRDIPLLMEQYVKELEAGQNPVMPSWEAPTPFCRVVGEVVKGLDEESTLQRWLVLLGGGSGNLSAFVRIRTAFQATLLWKWQMEKAFITPKKFHTNFGQSCQNDIDHISTFAPYVDALTTDNNMRSLCEGDVVADELKRFSCKIFSKNNYDEFETWLDTLLAEPATHNVRVQTTPVGNQ